MNTLRNLLITLGVGSVAIMIFIMSFAYTYFDIPFIAGLTVVGLVMAITFLFTTIKKRGYLVIES